MLTYYQIQIRSSDTPACCWDGKRPTKKLPNPDPFLRYTSILLGRKATNKHTAKSRSVPQIHQHVAGTESDQQKSCQILLELGLGKKLRGPFTWTSLVPGFIHFFFFTLAEGMTAQQGQHDLTPLSCPPVFHCLKQQFIPQVGCSRQTEISNQVE